MIRIDRHIYTTLLHLALVSCIFVLFTACSNDDAPVPATPAGDVMSLSVGMADDAAVTRSTAVTTQFQDFRLYGVKKVTGVLETVFNNYGFVQQLDASSNIYWEYATYKMSSADSARFPQQSYQYWDYNASEYRLIAGAPDSCVSSIDALYGNLTLTGLKMGEATYTSENSTNPTYVCPYFSDPNQLLPTEFGQEVNMSFMHALCQVRLAFYFEAEQAVTMKLKEITFGPAGDGLYATQGKMTVSYVFEPSPDWTATVSYTGRGNTPLKYAEVDVVPCTVTDPATQATQCTTSHYMLPTCGQPCIWTISLTATPSTKILGEKYKTANVPAADMQWQPNTIYTYIFKITDNGFGYFGVMKSAVADWDPVTVDDHSVHNW